MATFKEIMEFWFDGEVARIWSGPPDRGAGLLMGCPVWGKKYVERLVTYTLPSMIGGANLQALQGKSRLVLLVDQRLQTQLTELLKGVEHEKGIQLRLKTIPEEVIKAWEDAKAQNQDMKYMMLAYAQDILVKEAGRAGMGFHMIMPDHVYNNAPATAAIDEAMQQADPPPVRGYFPNLFRLARDHDGIGQMGVSADLVPAAEQLKQYRQPDGTLIVPDLELGNIGFRNLHKQMRAFLMNDASIPDRMPHSHFLAWQGRDRIVLASCHMNAAYLSPLVCAKSKGTRPATMDTELPQLVGASCYVPTIDDGLTFIELSDDEKPSFADHVPFEAFAQTAWMQARFRDDYLDFTRRRCEIPIKPQTRFLTDAQIREQHQLVIDMLVECKGTGIALQIVQALWKERDVKEATGLQFSDTHGAQ